MREIIFRGKTKEGKWVHGYFYEECELTYIFEDRQKIRGLMARNTPHEVIRETVGQYTGLKDKNGKEVYENDLIKIKLNSQLTQIMTVTFERGKWVAQSEKYGYALCEILHEAEGIGNIHESTLEER